MASYEGDVVYAPGFAKSDVSTPIEIMESMAGLYQRGGTVTPGAGDLPAGTAVKLDTGTNRYVAATYTASPDGGTTPATSDAEGFLRLGVNAGDSVDDYPKQGTVVLGGVLKAGALNVGGTAVDDDIAATLATTLGGHYDAARKVLKF